MKASFIKVISTLLACITIVTASLVGCAPSDEVDSTKENETTKEPVTETDKETETETETETKEETTTEKPIEVPVNNFETYRSNIVNTTAHNYMYKSDDGKKVTKTFRGVFKVQEYGTFDYKFFITNSIDSCSGGYSTNVGMPVKPYKIVSAYILKSGMKTGLKKLSEKVPVTFDGKESRTVAPNEAFWSDEVEFTVNEGEYLLFQWTVEFECIPATIVASTFYAYVERNIGNSTITAFDNTWAIPMPDLIGCNRKDTKRLAFIGDSITEGTGAGDRGYEFWVAQIADRLGNGYSVWNLGIDSARARDAIKAKHWLEKAKNNDIVCICIGINDIVNGTDEGQKNSTQIFADIKKIADTCHKAGAEIIMFTVPPFPGANHSKWNSVNKQIKDYAAEQGFKLFDFAAVLADPSDPYTPIYNDHPNAVGCKKVAEEFIKQEILKPIHK